MNITKLLYRCYLAVVESNKYIGSTDPKFGAFCGLTLTLFFLEMAFFLIVGHLIGTPFSISIEAAVFVGFSATTLLGLSLYLNRNKEAEFQSMKAKWASPAPIVKLVLTAMVAAVVGALAAGLDKGV